jgi:hypothetical protein
MATKYNIIWSGMDRGHDGQWAGPIWLSAFNVLAQHDGASYHDPNSPIYDALAKRIPSVSWKSSDPTSPNGWRLYFRDAQEPWSSTGVVSFDEATGVISITSLGKDLAAGTISAADVFLRAMENHIEDSERPFGILASAFLDPASSQGLTLQQLMGGVMQNFRPGVDQLESAISAGMGSTFVDTSKRRFKHMLGMLESVGAVQSKDGKWIGWNRNILMRLAKLVASTTANSNKLASVVESFDAILRENDVGIRARNANLLRIASCLLSKRFLIATGLAGSGKTKLAQAFARWLSESAECYKVVPVGADWTGNENVLGYPNGLDKDTYVSKPTLDLLIHARENPEIPHFLILDEMNLSHVERYFADILSLIESDEEIQLYDGAERKANGKVIPKSIELPKNLFIIGTVNVDETTYMFSPKVLDRANVIEFRMDSDELESFLSNPAKPDLSKLDGKGASFGRAFVDAAKSSVNVPVDVKPAYEAEMLLFFKALQAFGAEFGYRPAHEAARFVYFYKLLGNHADGDATWFPKAFDYVVLQKLLPKLHGSRAKLGPLLKVLWFLCVNDADHRGADPLKAAEAAARSTDKKAEPSTEVPADAPYPLSAEKIGRMWRLLRDNGFASFAEA